jgi:prepilin-type N-terminal cleavage/methylation domain-containing protein
MRTQSTASGFSLIELMVSMAILMVIMAVTLAAFTDATRINEASSLTADVTQNLRVGMNLAIRDLIQTGQGVPTGGIPIPSGVGVQLINRPSPPGMNYTFPIGSTVLSAVTEGPLLGPAVNGQVTDMITVLYADQSLPLNQTPLAALAANGSSMTVDAGTPITNPQNALAPGDLIMFSNAQGNAIQQITRVGGGQTVFFDAGDFYNLNQTGAAQGTIVQIRPGPTFPVDPITGLTNTTATRILMITYFIDNVTNPQVPRLARQINFNGAQPVALAMENFQISYDMEDGINTNQKQAIAPLTSNQIRKVNLFLSARSGSRYSRNDQFMRNGLTTSVSLRSLSYLDRYR